jgi:hypothetical protein
LDDSYYRAVLRALRLRWLIHEERELELVVPVEHAAEQPPVVLQVAAKDGDSKRFAGGELDRSDEDFGDHVRSKIPIAADRPLVLFHPPPPAGSIARYQVNLAARLRAWRSRPAVGHRLHGVNSALQD